MENNKLKELAQEFFDKCIIFQGVDDQLKAFKVENLYNFLADNQWKIYDDYQLNSFKNIIRIELDETGEYDVKNIPDELLDFMAKDLEESAFNEDRFRDSINDLFDWYGRDLEEYRLEEDE